MLFDSILYVTPETLVGLSDSGKVSSIKAEKQHDIVGTIGILESDKNWFKKSSSITY